MLDIDDVGDVGILIEDPAARMTQTRRIVGSVRCVEETAKAPTGPA